MRWIIEWPSFGGMKSHTDTEPVDVSKVVSRIKVSGSYRRVTLVTSPFGAISHRPFPALPSSAAKAAPESIRGAHHQSMDPVRSTRATVFVSPMMA
jgi:hypothetical protein